jgi:hypothetical protein
MGYNGEKSREVYGMKGDLDFTMFAIGELGVDFIELKEKRPEQGQKVILYIFDPALGYGNGNELVPAIFNGEMFIAWRNGATIRERLISSWKPA